MKREISPGSGSEELEEVIGKASALGSAILDLLTSPLIHENGISRARIRFGRALEGPPGAAHGGHVALLFDHALGWHVWKAGHRGRTGRLSVRYRLPTPLDTDLELEVTSLSATDRRQVVRAELRCDSRVTAEAEGLFVRHR